jgi:hypothetical protein
VSSTKIRIMTALMTCFAIISPRFVGNRILTLFSDWLLERTGFEPPRPVVESLQSWQFGCFATSSTVRRIYLKRCGLLTNGAGSCLGQAGNRSRRDRTGQILAPGYSLLAMIAGRATQTGTRAS